jgi:outer membrane protein OmpA-like peptidoglycan-associated protein/Tol biopolymer transport system component
MNLFLRHITLLFFILIAVGCHAQKSGSKSSKANESLQKARTYYDKNKLDDAIQELNKAIKSDIKFIDAYLLRGYIYQDQKEFELCIEDFKKVLELNPKLDIAYYNIAQVQIKAEKYDEAIENLNHYLKQKDISPITKKKAEKALANASFSKNAILNPVPFKPINLGDSINTADDEYWPTISTDNQMLIFTRNEYKQMYNGTAIYREDFYISKKNKDNQWRKAENVGAPINTDGNEGSLAFSPDGQFVFFVACEREDGKGSCDIYIAKRSGDLWKKPINLGSPVNSSKWESSPTFSSDGKTLYFSSNRGGNHMDIWKSEFDGLSWSKPVNVAELNTPEDEMAPFIHPDGKTMYFASSGHPGMGGLDLFYSRLGNDGIWSTPVNLGYPINTSGTEMGIVVDASGDLAYISSNRVGGKGKLDIYAFELYESAKPNKVMYANGTVYNAQNQKLLGAKFELIDLETNKTIVQSTSDERTGEFLVCLPVNKSYALNVSKDGYAFYSENFTLTHNENKLPFHLDVPLKPIQTGSTVVLKNVFFETNKYELLPFSFVELDKLILFLNQNPAVKIEIGGHTDNQGNKESNMVLAKHRAKSVTDYLISKNIAADRITYEGYGDTLPIADNTTPEGRQQNRRTEFKIISVNE